jgi:sulfite reductase (ferredoxin)
MTKPFYSLPSELGQDIEEYAGEVSRFTAGTLAAGLLKAKRVPRGVYEQRTDGTYMVRVRVAGGALLEDQADMLADLAEEFGDGQLHVTTRQDVQIHSVRIEDTPEVMRRLMTVGLTSKGGGGNTVRNVAACPYAGICGAEAFDVTPFAHAVTEYLIPLAGSYNLPRKYKIAFSGCSADCALARVNDLGFIAEVRDGLPGFVVYGGGGMGSHSRASDLIEEWVPAADVVRLAEATRQLFDELGDRRNRRRARLRFVFEKIGADGFVERLRSTVARLQSEGVPDCDVSVDINASATPGQSALRLENDDASDVSFVRQRQEGLAAVELHLPLGFIAASDFRKIAAVSRDFSGEAGFRTARRQNLVLRCVKQEDLGALKAALADLSVDVLAPGHLSRFTACAGAATCRLGLCLARDASRACASVLDQSELDPSSLSLVNINVSGCPNACGQHPVGTIGLSGAAQRFNDQLIPAYQVHLGARNDAPAARLAESVGIVPARALPELLVAITSDYETSRNSDEPFLDYLERAGTAHFSDMLAADFSFEKYADYPAVCRDWGSDEDFSLAGRGAGECGAGVFEVVQDDLDAATKAMNGLGAEPSSADLFAVFLPTVRALLITRGVDTPKEDEILRAFEQEFIDSGLVGDDFRDLIAKARGYLQGWKDALVPEVDSVKALLARVELLFSTMDAALHFHPPGADDAPQEGADAGQPVSGDGVAAEVDLRGVKCPMNFVKAKLKLEAVAVGETLAVILDEGAPIQNVPASFRNEEQDVTEMTDLGDGHWRILVTRKH